MNTQPSALSVRTLVRSYLARLAKRQQVGRIKPDTYAIASSALESFIQAHGKRQAHALDHENLEDWLDSHPTWGRTTRRMYLGCVLRCFKWAAGKGLLKYPFKKVKLPVAKGRSKDVVPTPEEHQLLLRNATPALLEVLLAIWATGARPKEIRTVTAADYRPELPAFVLTAHKTAEATGEDRVIYLTKGMVFMTQRLAAAHPVGPLRRTTRGKAWTAKELQKQFRRLRAKCGITRQVTPYSYRHKFATDALLKGVPVKDVATLLGHTNTVMVEKHYAHVVGHHDHLVNRLEAFR